MAQNIVIMYLNFHTTKGLNSLPLSPLHGFVKCTTEERDSMTLKLFY